MTVSKAWGMRECRLPWMGFSGDALFESEPGGREAAPGGLALVQAFVNTRELERGWELFGDPVSLSRWMAGRGMLEEGEVPSEAEVRRVREVREALRALLAANNGGAVGPGVMEVLDRAAGRAQLVVRFDEMGRGELRPATGGIDGALGQVFAAVYGGMQAGEWPRLKACRKEGCGWVFYDRSKNRSGRWCSMSVCGNREKTRAYRSRGAGRGANGETLTEATFSEGEGR